MFKKFLQPRVPVLEQQAHKAALKYLLLQDNREHGENDFEQGGWKYGKENYTGVKLTSLPCARTEDRIIANEVINFIGNHIDPADKLVDRYRTVSKICSITEIDDHFEIIIDRETLQGIAGNALQELSEQGNKR